MNTFIENENLTWELEEGVLSIAGKGKIPDYYIGKNPPAPWDEIADQILELEIENGVTDIGVAAFCKCRNLTLAVLPKSLVRIHYGAFEGCTALEDVMHDPDMSFVHMYEKTEKSLKRFRSIREKEKSSQIITFGMRAFKETPWAIETWGDYYVSAYTLIDVIREQKQVVIPEKVEEIGTMAFQNLNVRTVEFPKALKVVDNFAFEGTQLTSIVLPETVRRIGYGAFAQTPLEKVLLKGSVQAEIDPSAFDDTYVTYDEKNLFIYEMKADHALLPGVTKLGVKMKEIKSKAKKKEGIIGYESADISGSAMKLIQAGESLIGLTIDDYNHKLLTVETVAWNKKDKKPVYMKFDMATLEERRDLASPEGDREAARLTKNDFLSIFPGTDAPGMLRAGSIVSMTNRVHQEWYSTTERKKIYGAAEYDIVEKWLSLNTEYTV